MEVIEDVYNLTKTDKTVKHSLLPMHAVVNSQNVGSAGALGPAALFLECGKRYLLCGVLRRAAKGLRGSLKRALLLRHSRNESCQDLR
jgi:hypothetical protein